MGYNGESDGRASGLLSGILLGAVIGAGVALLFAPESGENTRRKISKRIRELRDDASTKAEELGDEFGRQGRRARQALTHTAAIVRDEVEDVM